MLLQIFTQPLSDRPTVFLEIIQRIGCTSPVLQADGSPAMDKQGLPQTVQAGMHALAFASPACAPCASCVGCEAHAVSVDTGVQCHADGPAASRL